MVNNFIKNWKKSRDQTESEFYSQVSKHNRRLKRVLSRYVSVSLKILKVTSHQWKPESNGPELLTRTVLLYWNYLLSSVATDS